MANATVTWRVCRGVESERFGTIFLMKMMTQMRRKPLGTCAARRSGSLLRLVGTATEFAGVDDIGRQARSR
ncbi:hypothetical protein AN480_03985 [Mycobacterium intracellulare subsp. chimaera]|uniref:Uncharacterized protein n=1 Tax=Mycobacterium asiaticum TaxID=1790 RepID=A0A1A3BVF6_MYCAS|nr:hypothetical protein AN480_03985 [Mycobacterium intracellulare subsp. chimaera]OBI78022.1 hypothetical protein A9X01_27690 [Mycobacterium asiaticum]